jgi:hypothetical protein
MRAQLKGKFATKPAYTLKRKVKLLLRTNWLSRHPFKVEESVRIRSGVPLNCPLV